jgi:hypothetical protein
MGRFDTKGVGQNGWGKPASLLAWLTPSILTHGSIRSVNLSMNFPFLYYQKIESL